MQQSNLDTWTTFREGRKHRFILHLFVKSKNNIKLRYLTDLSCTHTSGNSENTPPPLSWLDRSYTSLIYFLLEIRVWKPCGTCSSNIIQSIANYIFDNIYHFFDLRNVGTRKTHTVISSSCRLYHFRLHWKNASFSGYGSPETVPHGPLQCLFPVHDSDIR